MPSEEKLLNLIREKHSPRPENVDARRSSGPQQANGPAMPGGVDRDFVGGHKAMKFLALLAVIFLSYILMKVFLPKTKDVAHLSSGVKTLAPDTAAPSLAGTKIKPLSSYLDQLDSRDIFNTSFYDAAPLAADPAETFQDPTQNLKLVGVILDKNPQAIIEDSHNKQTFFVNKGDTVSDAVIEEIQEGKIILNYQGRRYELSH